MINRASDPRDFAQAPASDRRRAINTIVVAFGADPVVRWFYSEAAQYLDHFGDFVQAFGGNAFDEGTAWTLGDCDATAIWLAPNTSLDDVAITSHLESTVATSKQGDLFDVIGQMDHGHPAEPHWYLAWLGVDAAMQGRGLGHELLAQCLEIVDSTGAPAYLDNTNPRNIPLYERHGFRVVGQWQSGECPPLFGMLRDAK